MGRGGEGPDVGEGEDEGGSGGGGEVGKRRGIEVEPGVRSWVNEA